MASWWPLLALPTALCSLVLAPENLRHVTFRSAALPAGITNMPLINASIVAHDPVNGSVCRPNTVENYFSSIPTTMSRPLVLLILSPDHLTCFPERLGSIAKSVGFDGLIVTSQFTIPGGVSLIQWGKDGLQFPMFEVCIREEGLREWEQVSLFPESAFENVHTPFFWATVITLTLFTLPLSMYRMALASYKLYHRVREEGWKLFELSATHVLCLEVLVSVSVLVQLVDPTGSMHIYPLPVHGNLLTGLLYLEQLSTAAIAIIFIHSLGEAGVIVPRYYVWFMKGLTLLYSGVVFMYFADLAQGNSTLRLVLVYNFLLLVFTIVFSSLFFWSKAKVIKVLKDSGSETHVLKMLERLAKYLYISAFCMVANYCCIFLIFAQVYSGNFMELGVRCFVFTNVWVGLSQVLALPNPEKE